MNIKKNEQLAELVGILLGDGYLSLQSRKPGSNNRLKISFNSKDDYEYIFIVKKMLKSLFDIDAKENFRKHENTAELLIHKKSVIEFFVDKVGLMLSPKWGRASIPASFMKGNLGLRVLRGYLDTDGCVALVNNHGKLYPRIEMKICPSPMQSQFIRILEDHNFHFGVYQIGKGKVRVQLNGINQLRMWKSMVGFSNPKHMRKVDQFCLN